MAIKRNISIRKAAENALDLASQSLLEDCPDGDAMADAWVLLRDMLEQTLNIPPRTVERIVYKEMAGKDETGVYMPFGKYKDEQLCDIPEDYLEWCVENMNGLSKGLRRAIETELNSR